MSATEATQSPSTNEVQQKSGDGTSYQLANLERGLLQPSTDLIEFAPGDPDDPRNWSKRRKLVVMLTTSIVCLLTPATSSMVAPALQLVSTDLAISQPIEQQLVLSIFVLGLGLGPLVLGPTSEIYGRYRILQYGNLFFLTLNVACGLARSKTQMLLFRFCAGIGGAAPLVVGSGIIRDCCKAEERGLAVAIYNIAPLLGPSLGPIVGAFVTQYISWRWLFFAVSIVDFLVQILVFFCVRETYAPVLLERRRKVLIKTTGNTRLHTLYSAEMDQRTIGTTLQISLLRCLHMLITEPILQILSVYLACAYGLIYLAYSTFPTLWTQVHQESISIGSLNYFSLGLGYLSGSLLCGLLVDRIYVALRRRYAGIEQPEYRMPCLAIASLLMPVGLLWYGWSAQERVHWLVPNIGAGVFSMGVIIIVQCINTYTIDAYPDYAASAVSAALLVRNIAGTFFPLFAPYVYERLDYGLGNTVLALVAVCIGIPAPVVIWRYGKQLRETSHYARQ